MPSLKFVCLWCVCTNTNVLYCRCNCTQTKPQNEFGSSCLGLINFDIRDAMTTVYGTKYDRTYADRYSHRYLNNAFIYRVYDARLSFLSFRLSTMYSVNRTLPPNKTIRRRLAKVFCCHFFFSLIKKSRNASRIYTIVEYVYS